MSNDQAKPAGGDEDPLLTPEQHAARRSARDLRERSDQLTAKLARLTRPKELTGRFPRPAPDKNHPG